MNAEGRRGPLDYLAAEARFELTTNCLTGNRSAAELLRNWYLEYSWWFAGKDSNLRYSSQSRESCQLDDRQESLRRPFGNATVSVCVLSVQTIEAHSRLFKHSAGSLLDH